MKLDTVEVQVEQTALHRYMMMLDEREEVYAFVVAGTNKERTTLELTRDGRQDGVKLVLFADGTWKMGSCLIVGDNKNV